MEFISSMTGEKRNLLYIEGNVILKSEIMLALAEMNRKK